MTRVKEKDEFGCEHEYKAPEIKKCPICRREVDSVEQEYIEGQYRKHPEVGTVQYQGVS